MGCKRTPESASSPHGRLVRGNIDASDCRPAAAAAPGFCFFDRCHALSAILTMSDSREAALEKLQQDLDEIKADATYKGKTATAFEAFHDHALRIFGNGRLHAQRQLILEVVAEVVASLDHFWSEGFVERPSTTELYRRLNEIIVSLAITAALCDAADYAGDTEQSRRPLGQQRRARPAA